MFLGRLGDLHVRNVSTGKESILKDRAPPCFEEELYVGALPAGAYELRAFENFFAGGWISGSQTLKVSTAPGPFHISAQRLTDLGTMVFLRPLFPLESREFRFALEPSELAITRIQALIDSVARDPMLAAEPFSWDARDNELAALRLSTAERHATQDLHREGFRTPTGDMMFGEAFGQLVVRNEAGHWSFQQLPTIGPITSVAQSKEGVVAAGSTEGGLWLRIRDGAPWEPRGLPRADAVVRYLAFDDAGRLLAIAETSESLRVYSMDFPSGNWRDVHQFAATRLPRPDIALFTGAFLRNDQLRIFTMEGSFFKAGPHISSLSLADGHADTVSVITVRTIRAMPDGSLYGMSAGSPLLQTLRVSTDGVKWESRGSPKWAMDVVFRTPDEGYILRDDHSLRPISGAKVSLWKTVDGGRTWQKLSDAPDGSTKIIPLAAPTEMLLVTSDGLTFLSSDGGKTWQEERTLRTL